MVVILYPILRRFLSTVLALLSVPSVSSVVALLDIFGSDRTRPRWEIRGFLSASTDSWKNPRHGTSSPFHDPARLQTFARSVVQAVNSL
jgi:hypothetical protein